jgi:hypothetical protein
MATISPFQRKAQLNMVSINSPNAHLHPREVTWRESLSAFRLGVGQRNITPPVGLETGVWGPSKFSRSESINHGLFVTAVAREDETGPTKHIVAVDLCVLGCVECAHALLDAISSQLGIDRDDLPFTSSDTHVTPVPCPHRARKDGSKFVPGFIEQILAAAVDARNEAAEKITDVDITRAYGKCDLAVNRDLPAGP